MNKFWVLLLVIIVSPVIGGIYGVLHDQMTYSICPEYYTKFKFQQFGLVSGNEIINSARLMVSIVGIMATWWMGLIIGATLGLIGLLMKDWKLMLKSVSKSIFISILCAMLFVFFGYLYIKYDLFINDYDYWVPPGVKDPAGFITVAMIHSFSYLGGVVGLIAGILILIKGIRKSKKAF